MLRRVRDYLEYLGVRIVICAVQMTPLSTGRVWAQWLAWLANDVVGLRGKLVDENLRHAFPQLSLQQRRRLARRMWEHLFLLILEVAHTPRKIHETNWRKYIRADQVAKLVRRLMEDRPTIIVTGHFGNFEIGGYLLALFGFPSYTVARTLDNPYLDRFLQSFRGATGQHIIPKNGGYEQILEVLGGGGVMAFLVDQAAGPKDCWVDFFGRPASTYKAIALLALQHDAPICVCYTRRRERPMEFELVCSATADPRDADSRLGTIHGLTQWYTSHLEDAIRLCPEQYWWIHRRWKQKPRRRARRRKPPVAA